MPEYRSGVGTPYWYEWEIGLLKCLEMMTDSSVSSVTLQSVDYKSLDDVVVNYSDGSSHNIQVKHTDVESHFTYSTLASGESHMLEAWASDWKESKNSFQISEIHIITNKTWGPSARGGKCSFSHFINIVFHLWKQDYAFLGKNAEEQKAICWFKEQIAFLEEDAPAFIRLLSFEQEGDLADVEKKIENKIAQILGTDDANALTLAKNSLFAELRIWSTSNRKKQEITKEDVYRVLCCDSKILPKYDLYPEKPIFPSRIRFADRFKKLITTTDKKIVFLEGMPGSGKTNFVSYFAQLEDSPIDFRFYTYLPVNKEYPSYSDDEGYYSGDFLWRSILFQLKKEFEKIGKLSEIGFPLVYSYLTVSQMREVVLKYLPVYADFVGHTCYFFIDGLDHAARSKSARESFLFQLPRPEELGESVKIILVSQPVDEHFPKWISNNSQIEYTALPELEQDDVVMLLQAEERLQGVDINSLAQSVIGVVGNNALNVLFAIQEVKAKRLPCSFDEIIEYLKQKKLNGQINCYYDWIISSSPDDALLQKIEFAFAFLSQKVTLEQLALLCEKEAYEVAYSLAKLFPLIIEDSGYYYAFHNDVRLFFRECVLSARNYDFLASAIKDQIEKNDALSCFSYDVVFGSFLEIADIDGLLSFFTPEYVIKSAQYNISLNKLLSQFESVSSLAKTRNDLCSLHKLSLVATALQQFLSCVSYYAKENEFFDNDVVIGKTKSEKYILDKDADFVSIVHDTYLLLINEQVERAKKVFDEYLSPCKLNDYLMIRVEEETHDKFGIHEQSGFVCRYFCPDVIGQDIVDEEAYLKFVDGWLKASIAFSLPFEIETSVSFRMYYSKSLFAFVSGICKREAVASETFDVINKLLCGKEVHIAILVELCVKEILSEHVSEELINEILLRISEIESDETQEIFCYPYNKIICFFQALFCVYPQVKDMNTVTQQYESLLLQNRIKEHDRGFAPAMKQFECAQKAFSAFYSKRLDSKELTDTIYSLEYIGDKYGIGSCHDCEAYSVRKLVIRIIRVAYEQERDLAKASKLCADLMYLFTGEHARYDTELALLFVLANEEEKYLEIALHWAGPSGLMWKKEYDDLEYYYDSISQILKHFRAHELKHEIELRKKYRIISYSGHKDYSLNDLLGWYRTVPLCPEKLLRWGVQLLSVSDSAHEIGDNRMSNSIDNEVFQTAVDLGPQFVDALFELKNTPDNFSYWRECLLNAYWEKLHHLDLNDTELLGLYCVINAWINVRIEERKRNGYNKIKYLQHYNSTILEMVKDHSIRDMIKMRGYCTYEAEEYEEPTIRANQLDSLLELIKKDGYSDKAQEQICAALKVDTYGKVDFLLSVGEMVLEEYASDYISSCVIEYILSEKSYSMHENGLDRLVEKYSARFSSSDWNRLYAYVLSKSTTNKEMFYCVSYDLEILDLYYSLNNKADQLESRLADKMDLHWSLITACGLIERNSYRITLDPRVNSFQDFAKKHLRQQAI